MKQEIPMCLEKMPPRYPLDGTFELTVRCNLHCKMCLFRHDDCENSEITANELTAEQWIDMARQVAEAGTINLLITGGEPMLRPDFCEIWEGIYKQGFLITLYTNATLVNPKIMETLHKYPPHKIGVTIYGASPETYEKVCGNADAFQLTLNGLKLLRQLPSVIDIRTTLIKDNVNDIQKIEELINQELGHKVNIVHSNNVICAVRGGCAQVNDVRLSAEESMHLPIRRTCDAIQKFTADSGLPEMQLALRIDDRKSEDLSHNSKLTLIGCEGGMTSYTISWDGKLIACQLFDLFNTSPIKNGFSKAWLTFPYAVRLPLYSECDSCKLRDECSTCYAVQYAETGTLTNCSSYHKAIAQITKQYRKETYYYESTRKCDHI